MKKKSIIFRIAWLACLLSSNALMAQSVFFEPSPSVCGLDCYIMYAEAEGLQQPLTYQWNTGENSNNITICQPGCYTVTITGESGISVDSTLCLDLVFDPFPTIQATPDCPASQEPILVDSSYVVCQQACVGSTIRYSSSISGIDSLSSNWSVFNENSGQPADYTTIEDNIIEVTWEQPGIYSIYQSGLVNEPPFFCDAQGYTCVNVVSPPESAVSSVPEAVDGTVTLCQGQPLYLEYTGEDADTLLWNFGNGVTATGGEIDYTYPEAGTYELMLIASRFCACNDTTLLTINVEETETPIVDCVGTVCEGMLGTYTAQSDCGTFLWSVSEGGVIIDGGGPTDDFISVLWETGPEGTVELLTEDCPGTNCPVPAILVVPVISDQAEVEGPALVCPGSRAVYSVPAYEGVSFVWDVTNFGSIVSGQGTHEIEVEWLNTVPAPTQTVSVTFDNCYLGCGGSAELEVEIQPAFYLSGPIEVCPNTPATYDAVQANTGNPVPALWRLTDAAGAVVWQSSGSAVSVNIPMSVAPGFYVLTAEQAAPNAACIPEATRRVQVLSPPEPVDAIVGNTVICPGSTTTYSATPVGDNIVLEWTVNNGGTLTTRMGETINVTWGPAPPYDLSVVQVNTVGPPCTSSPVSLSAEAFDNLEVSGDPNACFDGISTFTATDAEHLDYEWTIIPATAGTIVSESDESTVDILWHEVGNVQVQAAVCAETAVFDVEVHALPQPTLTAPDFFCPNEEATVTAAPGFASYTWYNAEDTQVATGIQPQLGPGSYALVVTDEFGCAGTATFRIRPYPTSEVSISTPDPWLFCNLLPSTKLVAQTTTAGFSYQWYQDGMPIGTDAPEYTATAFGVYTVGITDQNGCTFLSNPFEVRENCGDAEPGNPPGPTCSGVVMGLDIMDGPECESKIYTDLSQGMLPGTGAWSFFFRDGVITATSTAPNPTIEHEEVGYYRVLRSGSFPAAGAPGNVQCYFLAVDSVVALADFHIESACANSPVAFEDLSTFLPSSGIASWSWDFGDPGSGADNTSALTNPAHTYSTTGDYPVTLTITTVSGCTSSTTKTVSVVAPPPVTFDLPEATCASSPTYFEVPPGGFAMYNWDFGDPGTGAANTSQRREAYHQYAAPGTYEVTLSATNIEGCTQAFSQNITISPNTLSGTIAMAPAPPVCEGVEVMADAPGGGISWQWSTGEATESVVLTEEGIYELTVTDANGCTYEPPAANVGITPAPLVDIRATDYDEYGQATAYHYESYSTCQGENVFLEVPNSELYPAYTYTWSTSQNGPAIEFSEDKDNLLDAGNYTFEVTAVDGATGCSAVAILEVIVHPLPDVPVILADQPAPICEGTMATLSVDTPLPGLTYVWSTGETGTAIEVSEGGEYTVTATNAEGCTQVSEAFELLPGPDIARVPNGCYTRCRPDTICLPDIPNVASYQWYFNGSPVAPPDGTMPELIIEESGAYYLEMVATNGCVLQSDPLTLELLDGYGSFAGEVYFDVNDNGIIDAPDTLLSGIDILLLQNGNTLAQSTSTQDGGYGFIDLPSNQDYTLQVDTANLEGNLEAIWVHTDTSLVGCDQVVVTDWLIRLDCPTASDTTLTFSACEGSSITYGGVEIEAGTQAAFSFTNAEGCDSTVNVMVEELQVFTNAFELSFCEGETLEHDGIALNEGQNEITLSSTAGCDSVLQIQVTVLEPVTTDQTVQICEGETYFFHGDELLPGESGTVMLISEAGCDSVVNLSVELSPELSASVEAGATCPNEETGTLTVNLTAAPNPPYSYAVDPAAPQSSPGFEGLPAGIYTVAVTDGSGCETVLESISIETLDPLQVTVDWDTLSCENPQSVVTVDITSGETPDLAFNWSDGASALNRTIGTPGTYDLQIDNGCETFTESIALTPPEMESQDWMYVPNAFSPNGDNNNDTFRAFTSDEVSGILDYRLQVFDRWGVKVFESTDPGNGWDGIMNGALRNGGVFAWMIQARIVNCLQEEVTVERRGEVLLLR